MVKVLDSKFEGCEFKTHTGHGLFSKLRQFRLPYIAIYIYIWKSIYMAKYIYIYIYFVYPTLPYMYIYIFTTMKRSS